MREFASTEHATDASETIPEAGYHEALAKAIAEGRQQLDEGKGIPLDEVKQEFGFE